jgi:DNA-binding response OmpR family regulator
MKVVMLSALGMKAEQRTGLAAGADGYLTKPFSPRELLAVVARMA